MSTIPIDCARFVCKECEHVSDIKIADLLSLGDAPVLCPNCQNKDGVAPPMTMQGLGTDRLMKIKAEAFGKQVTIAICLNGLNDEDLKELFKDVLEDQIQTGKIEL